MRILHIIATFPPAYAFGGPPRVAFDLCKALVKRGHEVEVYSTNAYDQKYNFKGIENAVIAGIRVYYFQNLLRAHNLFVSPSMIFRMRETLGSFDIVHVHSGRQLYDVYVGLSAKRFKTPYIIQAHGDRLYAGGRKYLKILFDVCFGNKILKDASKIIALSRFEAEYYKATGVTEDKISIIPNGIDLSEYANLPPKGSFKSKHNIPEDKKIILYLGRIHKTKGIDLLIKAHAHLKKKMGFRDAVLVIVGPDDGYLTEARVLANSLDIADSVMFTGPLYGGDKLEAYVDADVYVLPSRYETFPMTVLEAYACGKPVVASNVGGLRDLVVNGKTGLLFEVGNSRELAKNIHCLLSDSSKAKEMGLKGRKFVEENFTIDVVIEKLGHVYEDCLKNNSRLIRGP